jgi:hypothetical protein
VSITSVPTDTEAALTSVVNGVGRGGTAAAWIERSPVPEKPWAFSTRMWNGEPVPTSANVRPGPQPRMLAMWPPQAITTTGPRAVNVRSMRRAIVPVAF